MKRTPPFKEKSSPVTAGSPLDKFKERLEDPVKTGENVLETHQQNLSRKHTRSQLQHQSGGGFLMNQDEVFELAE